MIPMLFMLMISVYPTQIAIAGIPGETVEIPLLVASNEKSIIEGSGILRANEHIEAGVESRNISARINPAARPGIHESYLYLIPEKKGTIIPGTAVKVKTTVESVTADHKQIPGTQETFSKPIIVIGAIASIIAILITIAATSIRVRKT